MTDSDETTALRERLSRLCEAARRINQSLDFDVVLQGVLDSARSLTGARYGVLTLVDDSADPADFLASGMSTDESRALWDMAEGEQWLGYFAGIREPLRLGNLQGHLRTLGLPEFRAPFAVSPALSFLAAPISHGGVRVGNIFVGELPAGREFSQEDEEILVMFAAQAALVITNARRYREEQRARSDLETLIQTSPFGVLVFNARTGAVVSANREARRIVSGLLDPGQRADDLLKVLTVTRADGREFSLDQLSTAEALSMPETVRSEEIALRAPNGRTVTTLTNATPICAESGDVESIVVTLQDLEPLQELERQRVEFLGMVSHELRTPLAAIKGSTATVLDATAPLVQAEMLQFFRVIEAQADSMRDLMGDLLDHARIETGTLPVAPQPTAPVSLIEQSRQAFLRGREGQLLELDVEPSLPQVMADQSRIVQVLNNLLENAARHSPEGVRIRLSAARDGIHVAFTVADQGQGLSPEQLPRLFRKYSMIDSGATQANPAAAGLGLAICKGIVEAHGGRIWAESEGFGKGACFTFTLPAVEESAGSAPTRSRAPVRSKSQQRDQPCVLIVDDDPQILRYVREILAQAGYTAVVTADPEEAPDLLTANQPDLIVLDLMLPGVDGIELMTQLLDISDVPVIFISGYGRDEIIAKAFEMGAADYVVKPFSPTELLARIKAALRKRSAPPLEERTEPFEQGQLRIHYPERHVYLGGQQLTLTASEFAVLAELSTQAGRVVSHDYLLRRIWGVSAGGDARLVRAVVKRLRRKLDDDANDPTFIFTEPRVGYRMPPIEADTVSC